LSDISGIIVLSGLPRLEAIVIRSEKLTDISPLSTLVNLKWLNLDLNYCINGSELLPLANLKTLYLSPASSETIMNIGKLVSLESLSLVIDIATVNFFPLKNLVKLSELDITNPFFVRSEIDMRPFVGLQNLETIKLSGFILNDIIPLTDLYSLRTLDIRFSTISENNIDQLKQDGKIKWLFTHHDADH
jgi:internalin A